MKSSNIRPKFTAPMISIPSMNSSPSGHSLSYSPLSPPNQLLIDVDHPPPVHMATRSIRFTSTPPQLRSPSVSSPTADELSDDEDVLFKPVYPETYNELGYIHSTAHHEYCSVTSPILKRERPRSLPYQSNGFPKGPTTIHQGSSTLHFEESELNEFVMSKKQRHNFPSTFPLSALTVIADISSHPSSNILSR